MSSRKKTKAQLVEELEQLQQRIAALQASQPPLEPTTAGGRQANDPEPLEQVAANCCRDLDDLHRIGCALAASLDLQVVCQVIYQEIVRGWLNAPYLMVALFDEATETIFCGFAAVNDQELAVEQFEAVALGNDPISECIRARQPCFRDLRKRETLEGLSGRLAPDAQSALVVPLKSGDSMVGLLNVQHPEPDYFLKTNLTLLSYLADQAATALKNARLFARGERYAAELEERVAERHRVEEALRESEQRFRLVISSISDHIYVTEVTNEGKHLNLYLSPHVEAMTGYPYEKFINDWRFWPSTVIHQDDRRAADSQAEQLAQGYSSEVEYRLVCSNGKVIWVRDSARVQQEGNSRIVYGVVSDITERKRVELERQWLTNELRDVNQTLDERVRARTAELQAILDAVGEGIVVTDRAGVIQYLNPAQERLSGYTEAETLGRTPRLWQSSRQGGNFYDQMWQTILAGQTWRGELINRRKDGSLYDATLTITPILDAEGHPIGFVGVQHDITPFKQMDRIKSEFISTAAHELRTPLTSIQGFSEILLTRELTDDRQRRYLTFINQQAEALAAITDDLLSLSKLEAGKGFETTDVTVDIKQMVEELLFAFRESNPRHHYEVIGPETWPKIKGDPVKLSQLFKNLLSNATKYSPEGGTVTLTVEHIAPYDLLHLLLADQGIGMTREQLSHMFDRFYRADASNTAIGGTGLGMSISQLIVEKHRGKIWVESEYGVGTTVHILLPLPGRPPYVLIVEDEEGLRRLQQISLELEGFTVLTAEKGQPGLKLAQTSLPDLILLDLNLPEMSGFSVLDALRTHYLTRNIPVIITSALDQPEEIEKAIEKGAADYLVKPYGMGDLAIRINRALVEAKRGSLV